VATTLLFVYGTLLRGERNHHLLHGATALGEGRSAAAYELLDAGGYPAMVSGGTTAIVGEVYAVDEPTLAALDRLEDHPSYYRRTPIDLVDGRRVETYLLDRDRAAGMPRLPAGDWRAATAAPPTTRRGRTT
jgi:gamma-glutamylaminecyclotransferase